MCTDNKNTGNCPPSNSQIFKMEEKETSVIPDNNQETLADINEKIMLEIRHFLLNTPLQECKKFLWELYSAWVYNTSQIADPNEHADTLLFYERLRDLFDNTSELLEKHKQLVKTKN